MATFYNQATLTYSGLSTNSNIATGELLQTLSATKTPVSGTYRSGDNITYVINILNTGTAPYTNLTVNDDLGAYAVGEQQVVPLDYIDGTAQYYVNGIRQADPAVTAGPPLAFTGIDVPAGGNAQIIYNATVNGFASPETDGAVTNTATIDGTGVSTPVTATADVAAVNAPELGITKSISPAVVAENGQVTYTFTIQNTGNAEATVADNAVITDTFNPVLTNITAEYNGQPWAEGTNYTYDETAGLFTTGSGQITVPAATYTQNEDGSWTITPGTAVVTVTGTI